ncbi:uridine kinase [Halanaerobium sp.]|jgi:uridine kinase|uniref:uridine kinase n=1 Tax=Halanaerobium sp. TaxID=1895664 RepID=UPI000DE68B16|nr:uridine kinase [Halanaerobium sp.]PUU95023.1 MAG: uridine kinase [Halanaerobium sp.]HCX03598.1 uridine kinase [Clostridiales bacterium]
MNRPIFIGITGGSGSGKTTIVNKIKTEIPRKSVLVIEQDSYYKDQSELSYEERCKTNYDHPLAFDSDLLVEHLENLSKWEDIQKPTYDYSIHNRKEERELVKPKDIIILEGILIFYDERLRDLLDIKIFVDTDSDIRLVRRIIRDINERGRTIESVLNQYMKTVRPAHEQFIEPTKKFADIIIPEGGENLVAIDIMVTKIKSLIKTI